MPSLTGQHVLDRALSGRFRLLSPQVEVSVGNAIRAGNRAMDDSVVVCSAGSYEWRQSAEL